MGGCMERMMPDNIDDVLQREHNDRYEFFKAAFKGYVLDIACGIGYGSEIVLESSKVKKYYGKDVSKDALSIAKEKFLTDRTAFSFGDITNIEIPDGAIDSAISFETLEHLENPEKAVSEIKRVLKGDGVWVGSVPSAHFDEMCERVYGENPYHITRFTDISLHKYLSKHFEYILLFSNELTINSSFRKLDKKNQPSLISSSSNKSDINGSIAFLATNSRDEFENLKSEFNDIDYFINNLVDYDKIRYIPLKKSFDEAESMIDKKDVIIKKYEELLDQKSQKIEKLEMDLQSTRVLFKRLTKAINRKLRASFHLTSK